MEDFLEVASKLRPKDVVRPSSSMAEAEGDSGALWAWPVNGAADVGEGHTGQHGGQPGLIISRQP